MKTKILLLSIPFVASLSACSSKNESSDEPTNESYIATSSDEEVEEEVVDDNESTQIEDGTYSATVDYYNPETGFSNTYTLDVEVCDGQVVQIDFPNGGWLDEDHIDSAELDENGYCTVYGENGSTYEITLDL